MNDAAMKHGKGGFTTDQVREGSRYELSQGHPIWCAPTGGAGARGSIAGGQVLDSDPAVESAGLDAGYALDADTLRAPDIAVGNVPDKPGWIPGVPPLAVEYAGTGQDEEKLQTKIAELLAAGTRHVWVVRLVGPRRVEVYEPEKPVRTFGPGEELSAPGVLKNVVPIEALYDRDKAHELTLRNLLQRKGFESLEAVRDEGRLAQARSALRRVLDKRGLALPAEVTARIESCGDLSKLEAWLDAALDAVSADAALR